MLYISIYLPCHFTYTIRYDFFSIVFTGINFNLILPFITTLKIPFYSSICRLPPSTSKLQVNCMKAFHCIQTPYTDKVKFTYHVGLHSSKLQESEPLTVRKATPSDEPASFVATHLYSPASSFCT